MKLIKFEAPWCSGCKAQDAQLEKLKDIDIVHIDVDEDPDSANKFSIRSLPTMVILDDEDSEIKRFVGVTPSDKIQEAYDSK